MKKLIFVLIFLLSVSFLFGEEKENVTAQELYARAVKLSDAYDSKSRKDAFEMLKKAHQMGYVPASLRYGAAYWSGTGTSKDYEKSEAIMTEALSLLAPYLENDSNALYELGNALMLGLGVKKKLYDGYRFVYKAAQKDNLSAAESVAICLMQGYGCDKNLQEAFKWFEKAEKLGSARAKYYLSIFYFNGMAVKRDVEKALALLAEGEKAGDADCIFRLGYIYFNGLNVKRDTDKGIEYYTKAAEMEYGKAMSALGTCYDKGNGVPKDKEKAMYWLKKAAQKGDSLAINRVADEKEKEEEERKRRKY